MDGRRKKYRLSPSLRGDKGPGQDATSGAVDLSDSSRTASDLTLSV